MKRHVEDESSKGFASRLLCLVDFGEDSDASLRILADALLRKLKNALKFLLFMEEKPEHRVVYNLHPIHALLTFYFCIFAPSLVFLWLMQMGFFVACTAEMLLVLTVLEVLHITYDRPQNP